MIDDKAKYLVNKIEFIMNFLEVPWFYCFGKVLGFVVNRDFSLDYDIDIGVIADKCDYHTLEYMFASNGYVCSKRFLNDVTKAPLNLHFKPNEEDTKDTPEIDVYFWLRHNNKFYHTYDVLKEGKKVPSKYIFKGVPVSCLEPDEAEVQQLRIKDDTLRADGTWEYSVFGEYSGYQIRLPFAYGQLLDIWYPGWLFPGHKIDQSASKNVVEMKSCAGWRKL